jgi:hypothetical protein
LIFCHREEQTTKQSMLAHSTMKPDCVAEPVIGRAFARPGGHLGGIVRG